MNKEKIGILAQLDAFRTAHPGPFWASIGVAFVSMFGMVAAFGTAPSTIEQSVLQQTVIEQLSPAIEPATQPENDVFIRVDTVQRGDSVASLLARLGVQDEGAFRFLRSNPATQAIFRQLRPGKAVTAQIADSGELQGLIYPLNGVDRAIFIERRDGALVANERPLQLEKQVQVKSGEIQYSLFGATDEADIPDSVAMQLVDIFGGDINFHSDLRRGDRFSVVFETFTHLGKPVRSSRILAAEFNNNGNHLRAVWFENDKGQGGYYTPEGKSIRKAFLRSPLEFSRISSGFSKGRFHPILKTWRAHKGVDYAAPKGTRVKATSDGTVDFIGIKGGYGQAIVLRHQGRYTTLYGHLSGYASGLRTGSRVAQGDVIGYVGSTGWATGPHLHYELRINDTHQNPLTVALPTAPQLSVQQLAAFHEQSLPYLAHIELIRASNLALLD